MESVRNASYLDCNLRNPLSLPNDLVKLMLQTILFIHQSALLFPHQSCQDYRRRPLVAWFEFCVNLSDSDLQIETAVFGIGCLQSHADMQL